MATPVDDYRVERLYHDRGERQNVMSGGVSRGEQSLFIPENDTDEPSHDRQQQQQSGCQCPISYECDHRLANEIDCRSLVPEYGSLWKHKRRLDEEAYEIESTAVPESTNTSELSNKQLEDLVGILDRLDRPSAGNAQTREQLEIRVQAWILNARESNITKESLDSVSVPVLKRMAQFLDAANAERRKRNDVRDWVVEELQMLHHRWTRGDFNSDPKRGLIKTVDVDQNGTEFRPRYKVDKTWTPRKSARVFGNNGCVNGQRWATRVQMMRDGAHGTPVAGIFGSKKTGVYSIVMGLHLKDMKYADIDRGETIEYLGTALSDENGARKPTNDREAAKLEPGEEARQPTSATKAMMKSLETGNPVRVHRSCRLASVVKHRPHKGFRYDGLYRVVEQKLLNERYQIWSFKMERLEGQGRIRGFGTSQAASDDGNGGGKQRPVGRGRRGRRDVDEMDD